MPRKLRYMLEAALVYPLYGLSALLPARAASAPGARVGGLFYRLHRGSAVARRNLALALPERAAEHEGIIYGMWRNLGRVLFEYPHLARLWNAGRLTVSGQDIANAYSGRPCIFVGAHQGNWEINLLMMARFGWDIAAIYRPLNNPYIDPLLRRARASNNQRLFTKSAEGAMAVIRHVRGGGHAAMLVDQRLGDGITVPFFGRSVLAPPMAALLAVKYGAVLLPVRIERLDNDDVRLHATVYPPVDVPPAGTDAEKVQAMTATVYALFEEWIRARPEQWLWMHDRWRLK